MKISVIKTLVGIVVAGACLIPASRQSLAAEKGVGVYLLGFRGPMAGFVPPPGVYFQNDVYHYSGSASASREFPFGGQILAGVDAKMWVDVPTLLWSTPVQILGGNLGFSASLPIGGPKIDAAVALSSPGGGAIGQNLRDSITTIGDPLVSTFVAWHAGNFHWNVGVTINVPVGDYRDGALANISFNRWAADVFGAATWLDQQRGHELSGALGFTFNGENPATNYKTGTEFHAEFAAVQHFSKQFDMGIIGYYYQQISGDSGSGARLGPFKGRVAALGGTVGYTFVAGQLPIATRIKIFREFAVENRLEGTAAFFTVGVPLSVAALPRPAATMPTK